MAQHTIHFVTGNSGKFATMKKYADAAGIAALQKDIPLIEPQAETTHEISASKAKQAFAILQTPLCVHDAGMHIDALNGFPGPYVKYMLKTIGIEGLLGWTAITYVLAGLALIAGIKLFFHRDYERIH